MTCFAPLSECDLRDCLCSGFLLRILRVSFMSAFFGVMCFVRPSRCFVICILRGAMFCASFEVLCYVHPSRCYVLCILRGAMFCASFELLYYVHPSRCYVCASFEVLCLCIHRGAMCLERNVSLSVVILPWVC